MIVGTSYGFEPHKIIDVNIDGVSYRWKQSDIVTIMKERDNNINDKYKVCSIKSIFKVRQVVKRYTGPDSFGISFIKEGISNDYDGTTHMSIPDMISKMRDIMLRRVMNDNEGGYE